jgi:putative hemolysin
MSTKHEMRNQSEKMRMAKIEGFKKCNKMRYALYLIIALVIISGCEPVFALRNPSVVYCKELGYDYMTIYTEKGAVGVCKLPNNQIVETWEFLEGKVAQEYSYCTEMGYEIKIVEDCEKCSNIFTCECAMCILPDGNEVEVTELMALSFAEIRVAESICGDGDCTLFQENFSSCPEDCPSGGGDLYCDGVADGTCDPDCLSGNDPDCSDEKAAEETSGFVFIAAILAILIVVVRQKGFRKL